MSDWRNSDTFICAVSFEERGAKGLGAFLADGGDKNRVKVVRLAEESEELNISIERFKALGVQDAEFVDRRSSSAIWDWCWKSISTVSGEITIDITCLPRELLGMLLFAAALKRNEFERIRLVYVAAPPKGYASQNPSLAEDEKWLSKGVIAVRSIIGYPGDFRPGRRRRVIALAGHEESRLLHALTMLEPDVICISSEATGTYTSAGASDASKAVEQKLRDKITTPSMESVSFSANSITGTLQGLRELNLGLGKENISLIAMNTKLAFVGAALFAMENRDVRMVYAVPEEYNSKYCCGTGALTEYDITSHIKEIDERAIPAHLPQA